MQLFASLKCLSIAAKIFLSAFLMEGSVAEWSKALVLGTSQKWRGFESHHCQGVLKKFLGPLKSKRPWRHRGLNPGPRAPEAQIIPLDQRATHRVD